MRGKIHANNNLMTAFTPSMVFKCLGRDIYQEAGLYVNKFNERKFMNSVAS